LNVQQPVNAPHPRICKRQAHYAGAPERCGLDSLRPSGVARLAPMRGKESCSIRRSAPVHPASRAGCWEVLEVIAAGSIAYTPRHPGPHPRPDSWGPRFSKTRTMRTSCSSETAARRTTRLHTDKW